MFWSTVMFSLTAEWLNTRVGNDKSTLLIVNHHGTFNQRYSRNSVYNISDFMMKMIRICPI